MEKIFIPYKLALLAKKKGFKESCLAFYDRVYNNRLTPVEQHTFASGDKPYINSNYYNKVKARYYIDAPLYQQLVDWLKEKHEIYIGVETFPYEKRITYDIVFKDNFGTWCSVIVDDKNEALEEALNIVQL